MCMAKFLLSRHSHSLPMAKRFLSVEFPDDIPMVYNCDLQDFLCSLPCRFEMIYKHTRSLRARVWRRGGPLIPKKDAYFEDEYVWKYRCMIHCVVPIYFDNQRPCKAFHSEGRHTMHEDYGYIIKTKLD